MRKLGITHLPGKSHREPTAKIAPCTLDFNFAAQVSDRLSAAADRTSAAPDRAESAGQGVAREEVSPWRTFRADRLGTL